MVDGTTGLQSDVLPEVLKVCHSRVSGNLEIGPFFSPPGLRRGWRWPNRRRGGATGRCGNPQPLVSSCKIRVVATKRLNDGHRQIRQTTPVSLRVTSPPHLRHWYLHKFRPRIGMSLVFALTRFLSSQVWEQNVTGPVSTRACGVCFPGDSDAFAVGTSQDLSQRLEPGYCFGRCR